MALFLILCSKAFAKIDVSEFIYPKEKYIILNVICSIDNIICANKMYLQNEKDALTFINIQFI